MDNMSHWHIRPRDPLVLGDGRPLDRQQGELWPIPATLAAAVNGWLAAAARARVKGLEKSSLRGPLLSWKGQLWVPGPMDARTKALSGEEPVAWVTGRLVPAGEHVLWPDGALSLSHLYLPTERSYLPTERSAGGDKLLELDLPVPWEAALSHALQQAPRAVPLTRLHETESRIHVSINGETGTALDGALFQTTGTRLLEDVTYVFGWDGPALRPGLVTFGGEGRMAHLDPAEGSVFPAFPRDRYTSAAPERGFLRVQLLTPGLFPDARPWAPADPDGLRLVGAATGPYRAFSGWKNVRRDDGTRVSQPRPVRRCAPAGSVYWYGDAQGQPLGREALVERAAALWLKAIDDVNSQNARLGFGLCLPGFTVPEKEDKNV